MAVTSRRSRSAQDDGGGSGSGRGHSHGHSHGHGPATPASARLRTLITALLLPVAAAAVAGLVLLWPAAAKNPIPPQVWVNGTVTASKLVQAGSIDGSTPPAGGTTSPTGQDTTENQLTIQITSGPPKGATASVTVGVDPTTPKYSVGDGLVLTYDKNQPADGQYNIKDFQRGPPLMSLAIAFALFVLVVGRWRGAGAILALAVSFTVLVKFTLPAIVGGENSIEVAAVTAGVILFAALYATHGVSVRTSVAVLGTAVSLVLIGALGEIGTKLAHLSGLGDDNAATVAGYFHKVDIQGLLLAGIIIGALGVLNDVTATQVSSVWELKAADPSLGATDLFRAGMRIGRDHIGSTVNTLVLAYAGGSLPLFVLLTTSSQGWTGAAGAEVVAEDIVRTLVGSIGLAAAVPVTTALAAYFAASEGGAEAGSERSRLSSTDLRERRGRRGVIDDLKDDDVLTDSTTTITRPSRPGGGAAGRPAPVPRMPESRRSGEWNVDGTRVGNGSGPHRMPRPAPFPAPAPAPQPQPQTQPQPQAQPQPVADPYGQNPYGSDPYGSDPYGSDPYGDQQQSPPPYYGR
ncbi:YibE/F family protein [Catenulispora sp. NL8]|uniref:YibE/F family protein n=1 Tax=Catenulispora pinistramenti TaxID=2705254 RepID=A0ABS5KMZ6_9ACTN|nr:YibE/F family protein [Catenulispora pinistramenti]MBS2547391.1 YibE/F family protein [Catenulispora pinistramenti]